MLKTKGTKPFLTIIVPQYNELANLKRGVLEEINNFLINQNFSYEVIISDDGSKDGSFDLTNKLISNFKNFKEIQGRHGGKAVALANGVEEANGEWILFTDMDQSTPIPEIIKLLEFTDNYDVIIGSRGSSRNNSTGIRKLASFIFSNFRKTLLLRKIEDTQCGFKLFRSNLAKEYFPKLEAVKPKESDGWIVSAFDVELLFMCEKNNHKIKEVKVEWKDEDVSETKERKFVKESVDMLRQIFKVRWNSIRGKY